MLLPLPKGEVGRGSGRERARSFTPEVFFFSDARSRVLAAHPGCLATKCCNLRLPVPTEWLPSITDFGLQHSSLSICLGTMAVR